MSTAAAWARMTAGEAKAGVAAAEFLAAGMFEER